MHACVRVCAHVFLYPCSLEEDDGEDDFVHVELAAAEQKRAASRQGTASARPAPPTDAPQPIPSVASQVCLSHEHACVPA